MEEASFASKSVGHIKKQKKYEKWLKIGSATS